MPHHEYVVRNDRELEPGGAEKNLLGLSVDLDDERVFTGVHRIKRNLPDDTNSGFNILGFDGGCVAKLTGTGEIGDGDGFIKVDTQRASLD